MLKEMLEPVFSSTPKPSGSMSASPPSATQLSSWRPATSAPSSSTASGGTKAPGSMTDEHM